MTTKFFEQFDLSAWDDVGAHVELQGYSEKEIRLIERLYDIKCDGQFKDFLIAMGRSAGNFITGLLFYERRSVRNQVLVQSHLRNDVLDADFYDARKKKAFFLNTSSDIEEVFFILTTEPDDYLWGFWEPTGEVYKTDKKLVDYLQEVINKSRKEITVFDAISRGELLILDRPKEYFFERY